MTADQLYALTPTRTTSEVCGLCGFYYNFVPEINDTDLLALTGRVAGFEHRIIADHSIDGERIVRLSTTWYLGKPFMVLQNAGRGGGDYVERFVTDVETYRKFVVALQQLIPELTIERDILDPTIDQPSLTAFYGYSFTPTTK